MKIQDIRKKHEDRLLRMRNVVGVGIGNKVVDGKDTGRKCVRVYVSSKEDMRSLKRRDIVPYSVGTVETDVIEIGKIKAFVYKERMRPTHCGISIGHIKVSAGTLGCLVRDSITQELLILSNNHVLANSNKGKVEDDILQPGTYDGGTASDLIGTLLRFVKIEVRSWWQFWKKEPKNIVDCAVAQLLDDGDVLPDILEVGIPKGVATVQVGTKLQKTGRTTGHTKGEVLDEDVTVSVDYGSFIARFEHQIMAGDMSAGGDSGSLVLDSDKNAVGLLFAGSSKSTIINPIQQVLNKLNVQLVTK